MKLQYILILCALTVSFLELDARNGRRGGGIGGGGRSQLGRSGGAGARGTGMGMQHRPGLRPGGGSMGPGMRPGLRPGGGSPAFGHERPGLRPGGPMGPGMRPGLRPGGRPAFGPERPGVRPGGPMGPGMRPGLRPGGRPPSLQPGRPGFRPGGPMGPGGRPGLRPGTRPNPDRPLRQDKFRTDTALKHQQAFMQTKAWGNSTWSDIYRRSPRAFYQAFPFIYKRRFGGYPAIYYDYIDSYGAPPEENIGIESYVGASEEPAPEAYGPPEAEPEFEPQYYPAPQQPAWVAYAGYPTEAPQEQYYPEYQAPEYPAPEYPGYDYASEPVPSYGPIEGETAFAPETQAEAPGSGHIRIIRPEPSKKTVATDIGMQEDIS